MEFLVSIVGGGAGVAIVTGLFKLLENRQAHRLGKQKDKVDAMEALLGEKCGSINTLCAAVRLIMGDRIKHLARSYIVSDGVSLASRSDLIEMYATYKALGGNGGLDAVIENVKRLPIMESK